MVQAAAAAQRYAWEEFDFDHQRSLKRETIARKGRDSAPNPGPPSGGRALEQVPGPSTPVGAVLYGLGFGLLTAGCSVIDRLLCGSINLFRRQ